MREGSVGKVKPRASERVVAMALYVRSSHKLFEILATAMAVPRLLLTYVDTKRAVWMFAYMKKCDTSKNRSTDVSGLTYRSNRCHGATAVTTTAVSRFDWRGSTTDTTTHAADHHLRVPPALCQLRVPPALCHSRLAVSSGHPGERKGALCMQDH